MKVKIGNTIYDANDQPIMVILSEEDKRNISNMYEECTKYCAAPDGTTEEEFNSFMKTE